jgi:hypothetical protein
MKSVNYGGSGELKNNFIFIRKIILLRLYVEYLYKLERETVAVTRTSGSRNPMHKVKATLTP